MTLLVLVHASYIRVLFFTHIPFVVNRTFNATPTVKLQQMALFKFFVMCFPQYGSILDFSAGLRSRRKNDTAPTSELLVFMSVAPASAPVSVRSYTSIFSIVLHGVLQGELKMKCVKCTKLKEYTKLV